MMTDEQLLASCQKAYLRPEIQGIRGDVRTPTGTPIPGGVGVNPAQAIEALFKYYGIL